MVTMGSSRCRLQQVTQAETACQAEGTVYVDTQSARLRICGDKHPRPAAPRQGGEREEAFSSCHGQDEVRGESGQLGGGI